MSRAGGRGSFSIPGTWSGGASRADALREPVLEAGLRGRVEAVACADRADARRWLPGRVFPAVGNHEVWDDSDVQGLLEAFPYLKQFGVSDKRLIYKFDFNGARFIFLWTGKYDYRSPSSWDADRPAYEAQMKELKRGSMRPKRRDPQGLHQLPRPGLLPLRHGPNSGASEPPQGYCVVRQGLGHRRFQRARAHDRALRWMA